jgi:hypothetical protein
MFQHESKLAQAFLSCFVKSKSHHVLGACRGVAWRGHVVQPVLMSTVQRCQKKSVLQFRTNPHPFQ